MIATKQLQQDGTTKIIIYKPIDVGEKEVKYVTPEDLDTALKTVNEKEIKEIRDELKSLKKQIRNLEED